MVKKLLFVFFFFSTSLSFSQNLYGQLAEICDNGIDDDGDGDIDLNDDDCDCPFDLPTSLIPNPSFEEQTDCPTREGQLELAIAWQQASDATTDYMHTCDFIEHPIIREEPPLPMPDGEGCIGFRNGKPSSPNFKESTGSCLLESLEAGTSYTMNMWVGFASEGTSPEFELALYGAFGCGIDGILPYAAGNQNIGCPLNVPGYELLGSVTLSGENEWVNADIAFTPSKELDIIVIGPNCAQNPFNHYYFFDNLIVQETAQFGEAPKITGHPCQQNVALDLPEEFEGSSFQWYKDGIAIEGAISENYTISADQEENAQFQIRIIKEDGSCKISAPYIFNIPEFETFNFLEICDNDIIQLNEQDVNEPGLYTELFFSSENCDSTVITSVSIFPSYDIFIEESICIREEYILGSQTLNTNGIFTEFFFTQEGCDSVVTVDLEVLPSLVSVDAQGGKTIRLGEQTPIKSVISNLDQLDFYYWTSSDSTTLICDTCLYQVVEPTETTTYTFNAIDIAGCDVSDNVVVNVDEYYEIYFPSAFSPNGDGINDFYIPLATTNVSLISNLRIYDRWGNQVYENSNIPINSETYGWDGLFRTNTSNTGVYVYLATIEFVDGHIETFKGDFVLLK